MRVGRVGTLACALVLLLVNVKIAAHLFGVEYTAYTGSVEGTFIANARVMAEHPGQWGWWPLWACGLPLENTYLPFLQWVVAAFHLVTGYSPARSFHIVTAAFYALGAPVLFWMALVLSGKRAASFLGALAYSCISPTAWLMPEVRADIGGLLNLRRLQAMVVYGEAPHVVSLTFLPLAVALFALAVTRNGAKWKILAGVAAAFVVLSNAFGAVGLALALVCWLVSFRAAPWWRAPATVAVIGVVSYCWVSPWLSPGMIRAMRANSPTAGGDYRYTAASWVALGVLAVGFPLLWLLLQKVPIAPYLRFFVLFAAVNTAIVMIWQVWQVPVIPQPNRYQLEMEMALLLALVFAGAAVVERFPKPAGTALFLVAVAALGWQSYHVSRYARRVIQATTPEKMVEYRIAKWMDANRHGERAFLGGSTSLQYNIFTDNPQFHGGHSPFLTNPFVGVAAFIIYTGMNAGNRDAEVSLFWLKAFGAQAISVSGPNGKEFYKPFTNPRKFDGVLPVLWREADDTIYEVPERSKSLAHVIPREAVPARAPIHGLDTEPARAYVEALDDPRYPEAAFQWEGMSEARINTTLARGQVVAVQVNYDRGWEAYANGKRQPVRRDSLGLMVIEPDCDGICNISLRYTGGWEKVLTRVLSGLAMAIAVVFAWRRTCHPAIQ